tara:strand:- start:148 stop:696 length:549 start_codon:yes stop_codon:yes gene_type:complete
MVVQSEEELAEIFLQSDNLNYVFNQILRAYKERVYWLIRRMVLTHEDANDLTQEVFIKIWEKRDQFKGQSALFTWIYRIAVNHTLGYLRKEKRKAFFSLSDPESKALSKLEADPYYSGDEMQLQFQKALLTLPEKQRLVFQMKYFDEMKYEEISDVLDTSVGSLKASYHHATTKLKKFLLND